jgi:hypothetical protein
MIKKIIFLLLFFVFILSCGKKTDPEYRVKKDNILIKKYHEIY